MFAVVVGVGVAAAAAAVVVVVVVVVVVWWLCWLLLNCEASVFLS
jgi:hypothetical protein